MEKSEEQRKAKEEEFIAILNELKKINGLEDTNAKDSIREEYDVNTPHDESLTLCEALSLSKYDVAEKLIKDGADTNAVDSDGEPPIILVSSNMNVGQNKNKDMVELLHNHGADINSTNGQGDTALHWACVRSNTELVKFLIDKGADVNKQNNDGENALARVDGRTDHQIIKDLLEAGSDVNMQKYPVLIGMIPLSMCRRPEEDMLTWWERKEHIHILENMKMLIEAGANINIQDSEGKTPLIKAVKEKHADFVKFLCAAGADLEIKDNSGKTAYDYATEIHDYVANKSEILEIYDAYKPDILEIIKKAKLESLQKGGSGAVALQRAIQKRLTGFANTLSNIAAALQRDKQRQ